MFSFPGMFAAIINFEWKVPMVLTCVDQFQIAETRVLIMEDMLVFLQEKDQKYSLLSLDQKVRYFSYASIVSIFQGTQVSSEFRFI